SFAQVAHPLISEDTGTQGSGRFELELGASRTPSGGGHALELDPQLSYGARADVDLILRASVLRLTGGAAQDAGHNAGFGPSALDFKWRAATRAALSLGLRAGLDLPTA